MKTNTDLYAGAASNLNIRSLGGLGAFPSFPPVVKVSANLARYNYTLYSLKTDSYVNMTLTDAFYQLHALAMQPENTTLIMFYRQALNRAGDQGVQMMINAIYTYEEPLFFENENVTSVILGVMVDLLPPSALCGDFIASLLQDASLEIVVRAAIVRESTSLACPTPLLFEILNSTIYDNQTTILTDSIAVAMKVWANNNCSVSYMEALGHTPDMIHLVEEAAMLWRSDRWVRMTYVPLKNQSFSHRTIRDIVLDNLAESKSEHKQAILTTALGNIGHVDDTNLLISTALEDKSPKVCHAAAKALRRMPTNLNRDIYEVLFNISTQDDNNDVRRTAGQSLIYLAKLRHNCHHPEMESLIPKIEQLLASMHFDKVDLEATRQFLIKRAYCLSADHSSALTAVMRVQQLIDTQMYGYENVFLNTTHIWGEDIAAIGLHTEALYGLASTGFYSHAYAALAASLYGHEFPITDAGAIAAWSSNGFASLTIWFLLYLINPLTDEIKTFDVLLYHYEIDVGIGISSGNICSMETPKRGKVAFRTSRTFARFSFYYGIPAIADVDVSFVAAGWFEIQYGILIVLDDKNPGFDKMAIKAFVKPALGVDGQASANAHLLFISGGVAGTVTIANVGLPIVAIANTNTTTLGADITLASTFMKGQVNFYYDL